MANLSTNHFNATVKKAHEKSDIVRLILKIKIVMMIVMTITTTKATIMTMMRFEPTFFFFSSGGSEDQSHLRKIFRKGYLKKEAFFFFHKCSGTFA